jgi:hypothetical protein
LGIKRRSRSALGGTAAVVGLAALLAESLSKAHQNHGIDEVEHVLTGPRASRLYDLLQAAACGYGLRREPVVPRGSVSSRQWLRPVMLVEPIQVGRSVASRSLHSRRGRTLQPLLAFESAPLFHVAAHFLFGSPLQTLLLRLPSRLLTPLEPVGPPRLS